MMIMMTIIIIIINAVMTSFNNPWIIIYVTQENLF